MSPCQLCVHGAQGGAFPSLNFTLTNSNFTEDQMGSWHLEFRGDIVSPSSTLKEVRSHVSVTQPFCYLMTQSRGVSRLTGRDRLWSVWGLEGRNLNTSGPHFVYL